MTLPQFAYLYSLSKNAERKLQAGRWGLFSISRWCERVVINEARGKFSLQSTVGVVWCFPSPLHTRGKEKDISQFTSSLMRQTLRGLLRRFLRTTQTDFCPAMYYLTVGVTVHPIIYVHGDLRTVSFDNQGQSGLGFDWFLTHTKERLMEALSRGQCWELCISTYCRTKALPPSFVQDVGSESRRKIGFILKGKLPRSLPDMKQSDLKRKKLEIWGMKNLERMFLLEEILHSPVSDIPMGSLKNSEVHQKSPLTACQI